MILYKRDERRYAKRPRFGYRRHSLYKQQHESQDGIETTVDLEYRGSSNRILYHSNHRVKASVGQKLKTLINSMDRKKFIVEDVADGIKRTDIISQFRHFPNYLEVVLKYDKFISLAPTLYLIKAQKFLTEINGLPHAENKELYTLIEKIFNKFMPMFGCLFNESKFLSIDSPFDQFPVIIKIQKYDITKECSFNGHWHSEGTLEDDIMAGGLYYFDISESECLRFNDHYLEIAHQKTGNTTVKIEIYENECMVFKNLDMRQIVKHRASFSTKKTGQGSSSCHASKCVLSFFLRKKRESWVSPPVCKWYNYPWKTDIFVHYFYKGNVYQEIIDLIAVFAFGTFEHRKSEISSYVKKWLPPIGKSNNEEPFP